MNPLIKIACSCFLLFIAGKGFAQKKTAPFIIIKGKELLSGDSSRKLNIRELNAVGYKKTKSYIIYREIPFKKGDSITVTELYKKLLLARQLVYNTSLFNDVILEAVIHSESEVTITARVSERWYIYPVPQFQLVDRNFNVWARNYDYSLSRVNYGLKFVHYNLSGRKDQLRIYLLGGYSRNISFSYTAPYSNHALTEGFTVSGGYSDKRELAYKTNYRDSLMFYPFDSATRAKNDFVYRIFYLQAGYILRKGMFKRHQFLLSYSHLSIDDSIAHPKYNPNYLGDGKTKRGLIDISYLFQYTNVNNVAYPLSGTSAYFYALKRGLGISGGANMLQVEAGFNRYFYLGRKWFASFNLNGKVKLPFDQPYINQRGLGYSENYLRGMEYYVIDGAATGLARSTLKKKLLSFKIPFPFFPKLFTKIPFTFFGKTYADLGFAHTNSQYRTELNNRLLYSGGVGIDVLTLYDIVLRFEYSVNQFREGGLYFHSQNGF